MGSYSEPNLNYITENEFWKRDRDTNERIGRLEKLVFKLYDELDQRLRNTDESVSVQIEEHKDAVVAIFNGLNDEIQQIINSVNGIG